MPFELLGVLLTLTARLKGLLRCHSSCTCVYVSIYHKVLGSIDEELSDLLGLKHLLLLPS